ncbi:FbpB family small basic protein [Lentibacillus cibarius]|uniref:FbpB family small basic protein n=1 Tax=Lentibacillus cibarius TaxID=2583219 RepID=A0A5S3QQ45_9BACI|nr:FbpB family small basic protein [Lentibacillus cibarius]TMN22676.1 FbpB family small basic protein [Lentibacillus cibarius]
MRTKTLEELTDQIKEELLNDDEALKKIEQKIDERYSEQALKSQWD